MPTFSLAAKHQEHEAKIARDIARIAADTVDTTISTVSQATLGGDERRLRGIPAIGRGVTGAIAGTKPGARL
jgi:hypothetical protein